MIKDNDTKQLILDSALKNFTDYGYQASAMRKISNDIGFTPGALYGYFKSKEELFYALTDKTAIEITKTLDAIRTKMEMLPEDRRLNEMCHIFYSDIPSLVDVLRDNRQALNLIINCSKGTKYEHFLDDIAKYNANHINDAAKFVKDHQPINQEIMDILMDGYIRTLFNLILSNKKRETVIESMETIAKIYESGILSLMKKEE